MCCCILSPDCSSLFSPGDLADKLSITIIKLNKLGSILPLEEEFYNICKLTGRLLYKQDQYIWKSYFKLVSQLISINLTQWSLEDRVRIEKNWEAAVAARDNNTIRVNKKNEVNLLLGYLIEVKKYKTN